MNKKNEKKLNKSWIFLIIMIFLYIFAYFYNKDWMLKSLKYGLSILKSLVLPFIIVFLFLAIFNLLFKFKKIKEFLIKTKQRGLFFGFLLGTVSVGPIYVWYVFLKDLREKGFNYGFIAAFLYARAIKIPLIPLMVAYFGVKFTALFVLLLVLGSFLSGLLAELFSDFF